MLINAICTNCEAVLKAPESALGKRVRCKKCGEVVVLRLTDEEDEDLPVKTVKKKLPDKPLPSKIRVKAKSDEDEDEDEEDARPSNSKKPARQPDDDARRPKGKKKGKKKAGPPVLLFVLLGGGGLLAILLVTVVYFGFIKKDSTTSVSGAKGEGGSSDAGGTTAAWVDFSSAENRYKARFPSQPNEMTQNGLDPDDGRMDFKVAFSERGGSFTISATPISAEMRQKYSSDKLLDHGCELALQRRMNGYEETGRKTITHQGHPARELTFNLAGIVPGVARIVLGPTHLYMVIVGASGVDPNTPKVKAFFEGFKIQ